MNNGRTMLLTRGLITKEVIIDKNPAIKKPIEQPRNPQQYREAKRQLFFEEQRKHNQMIQRALNSAQKASIEEQIYPLLKAIVQKLKPYDVKLTLSVTIYNSSLGPQYTEIFKQRGILELANQLQGIIFHPCPQELLKLTEKNDDTAPPVTKEAVASYIHELVKNIIDAAERQLQEIYETTSKLRNDAKQDPHVAKKIFETPELLELFKNDMGTFHLLIEDHLGIVKDYLDILFPLLHLNFWDEQAPKCPMLALALLDKPEMVNYLKQSHSMARWIDETINIDRSVADKILSMPELTKQIDSDYILETSVLYENWKKFAEENSYLSRILKESEMRGPGFS
jgi:hypothetical protein